MGVDSGEVIMGPAGGSHRKENIIAGTVLKNAVYAAQRGGTEGAQTGWGVSTLMTSTVYALVKKNYTARALTENTDIPLFMLEKSIISGEQNVYTGNQMPLTAEGNRFCHH
jgi:hypothetical protein